ncbi:MAG: dTDP-4-amino-4,6-dideoxygalactose transaminase, partial [Lachnospiraceae bacterium]|nr:dTDP-4-amino-4,6-dideoxygalactose transaminase [Lachnospiraceae bacterium]
HYAGVGCEMDTIMDIARRYDLTVIEDAAQGIMATYKDKPLGAIGDFGCYSFHETKNFSMGEGGAILIKDEKYIEKAEIFREKGTDRSKYYRGQVDKYRWQDYGSSYLPSELNAAYLWAQLELADSITADRMKSWNAYRSRLKHLSDEGKIELQSIPEYCKHNAHMFYIKLKDIKERTKFIEYMKANEIMAVFHYVPLHSAPAGEKYCRFHGEDKYTTRESERLVRLPLYYGLLEDQVDHICETVENFFK